MKFAVIGGDMRQVKLAELLAADGFQTVTFALDKICFKNNVIHEQTPKHAAMDADCVILPLPMQSREGLLTAPLSSGLHTVREIVSVLSPKQCVLLGKADDSSRELLEAMGITYTDYYEREELQVQNAVAAAEGAIGLIMQETAVTIWGSRILVIGYGRLGSALSRRLRLLGAEVTVSARSKGDHARIRADGMHAAEISQLDDKLSDYDIIVNTVPSRVLGEKQLREVAEETLCLDLASKPGGIDFTAAAALGVRAMWALSLPGEVAPTTGGRIIRDTVYNILSEQGAVL